MGSLGHPSCRFCCLLPRVDHRGKFHLDWLGVVVAWGTLRYCPVSPDPEACECICECPYFSDFGSSEFFEWLKLGRLDVPDFDNLSWRCSASCRIARCHRSVALSFKPGRGGISFHAGVKLAFWPEDELFGSDLFDTGFPVTLRLCECRCCCSMSPVDFSFGLCCTFPGTCKCTSLGISEGFFSTDSAASLNSSLKRLLKGLGFWREKTPANRSSIVCNSASRIWKLAVSDWVNDIRSERSGSAVWSLRGGCIARSPEEA